MTISVPCLTGEHDHCDRVVVIDNETWPCSCFCHEAAGEAA